MTARQISQDQPVIPSPDGSPPNFNDPPSLHAWTLGVGVTSMVIMTLAVGVRTYTKLVIIREMRHEDYVAIFALIGFLVWGVIYIYLSSIGLTRDLWNIRAVDFPYMLYLANVFQVIYPPAMGAAKYFVCIQLRRIFCPIRTSGHAVWWALQALIAATIAYYIACFFTFLFQCVPREKIWHPAIEGKCIDNPSGVLSAGIINLILDLGILAVPIWAIWRLQMPVKSKLGATAIFGVGFLTCAIAALGIVYRVSMLTDMDQTMAIAKVGLWTFAELTGTILVGCMPMFPRFYQHFYLLQRPFLSKLSIRSLLSSWKSRNTDLSDFSRRSRNPKSQEQIYITSEFTREDIQGNPDYVELRDGPHGNPRWRSTEAV